MKKNLFITFEGGEGSGKSSLARFAYDYLKKKKKKVILTREPGGTKLGEKIRALLLSLPNVNIKGAGELLLYCAARHQVVQEVIGPALQKGQWVICDRYQDSTYAYQGFGEKVSLKVIEQVNRAATGGLKPDVTFLVDVPVELGLKRAGRGDRIEKKSLLFHRRVRQGFLTLAKREPKRFIVLDSRCTLEELKQAFQKRLEDVLS